MSRNLGFLFLPLAPNLCSNDDKNKIFFVKKKGIIVIIVDFIDV